MTKLFPFQETRLTSTQSAIWMPAPHWVQVNERGHSEACFTNDQKVALTEFFKALEGLKENEVLLLDFSETPYYGPNHSAYLAFLIQLSEHFELRLIALPCGTMRVYDGTVGLDLMKNQLRITLYQKRKDALEGKEIEPDILEKVKTQLDFDLYQKP